MISADVLKTNFEFVECTEINTGKRKFCWTKKLRHITLLLDDLRFITSGGQSALFEMSVLAGSGTVQKFTLREKVAFPRCLSWISDADNVAPLKLGHTPQNLALGPPGRLHLISHWASSTFQLSCRGAMAPVEVTKDSLEVLMKSTRWVNSESEKSKAT